MLPAWRQQLRCVVAISLSETLSLGTPMAFKADCHFQPAHLQRVCAANCAKRRSDMCNLPICPLLHAQELTSRSSENAVVISRLGQDIVSLGEDIAHLCTRSR